MRNYARALHVTSILHMLRLPMVFTPRLIWHTARKKRGWLLACPSRLGSGPKQIPRTLLGALYLERLTSFCFALVQDMLEKVAKNELPEDAPDELSNLLIDRDTSEKSVEHDVSHHMPSIRPRCPKESKRFEEMVCPCKRLNQERKMCDTSTSIHLVRKKWLPARC